MSLPRLALDVAFSNVASVSLIDCEADDSTLAAIAPLTSTRYLGVLNADVTDTGMLRHWKTLGALFAMDAHFSTDALKNAAWLMGVNYLSIDGTVVDDSLWPLIECSEQLVDLGIGGTQITDIAGLANHPHLSSISITSLPVSFEPLADMPCARRIKKLYANECLVSDASFRSLLRLPNIVDLAVGHNNISDAALEYVSTLSLLEELVINDTHVSDNGIRLLSNVPNLCFLCITGTAATETALETLSAFPSLDTVFSTLLYLRACPIMTNRRDNNQMHRSCGPGVL